MKQNKFGSWGAERGWGHLSTQSNGAQYEERSGEGKVLAVHRDPMGEETEMEVEGEQEWECQAEDEK